MHDHRPRVRRRCYSLLTVMIIFAGLAGAALLGGCGSGSGGVGSAQGSATTWKAQDASAAGPDGVVTSVAFVDATHGWAVAHALKKESSGTVTYDAPVILTTSNGGASWKTQDSGIAGGNAALNGVTFVDAAHGWTVGGNGNGCVILATDNGGATWKAQDASSAGSSAELNKVAFVDAIHGWAVGGDRSLSGGGAPVILATNDGGMTWEAQDASGSNVSLSGVAFVDVAHGWAVGNNDSGPVILATSDGGATWETQYARTVGGNAPLSSVAFADATHGWAVGMSDQDEASTSVILATSDGGATWNVQDAGAVARRAVLGTVTFVDVARGWAVGRSMKKESDGSVTYSPLILATSDGGATWTAQDATSAGSSAGLGSVAFADATHGWAVGVNFDGSGNPTTPVILAYGEKVTANAAGSRGVAVWLIVAAIIAIGLIGALGAALAMRRRKAKSVAVTAGPQAPDPGRLLGDVRPPGAAPAGGEKARYCTKCGSVVGAGSTFCSACGAKVVR
jgi:photosystem II stability/assembly factor-like uncharacterized protein